MKAIRHSSEPGMLLELDGFACGCENLFGELFIIHDARKDYGSHHG